MRSFTKDTGVKPVFAWDRGASEEAADLTAEAPLSQALGQRLKLSKRPVCQGCFN